MGRDRRDLFISHAGADREWTEWVAGRDHRAMDRERDMSIGDVWRTAGRTFRVICLTLPILGILAVALGAYGDAHRFWITRPFLTNVASGVTAAFFGIPFTLLVLGWLTGSQARRARKRAVSELACSSAKAFRNSVLEIVTPRLRHDSLRETQLLLNLLSESEDIIKNIAPQYYSSSQKFYKEKSAKSDLLIAKNKLAQAISIWASLLGGLINHSAQAKIMLHWNFIVDEINPAMLGTNGVPVEASLMVRVSELVHRSSWQDDGWLPNIWRTNPGKSYAGTVASDILYQKSVSNWMDYDGVVAEISKARKTVEDFRQFLMLADQIGVYFCAGKNFG